MCSLFPWRFEFKGLKRGGIRKIVVHRLLQSVWAFSVLFVGCFGSVEKQLHPDSPVPSSRWPLCGVKSDQTILGIRWDQVPPLPNAILTPSCTCLGPLCDDTNSSDTSASQLLAPPTGGRLVSCGSVGAGSHAGGEFIGSKQGPSAPVPCAVSIPCTVLRLVCHHGTFTCIICVSCLGLNKLQCPAACGLLLQVMILIFLIIYNPRSCCWAKLLPYECRFIVNSVIISVSQCEW